VDKDTLNMKIWLAGYGAALLVVGVLDALWLGVIARDFYRRELGELMTDSVRLVPAAIFYFGFPAGLVTLVLSPLPATLVDALWKSALLGLVAYGTYDMTNLATIRGWSLKLSLADMAWGTFIAAAAGGAAWSAMRWIAAR
jgi:uncharacterized membrane protein